MLAVPDANDALTGAPHLGIDGLASPHRGCREFFVDCGTQVDVVLVGDARNSRERKIEPTQRRPRITRDEYPGASTSRALTSLQAAQQPAARLTAGDE